MSSARDVHAVLVAQQVLEEDLEREREPLDVVVARQRRETVDRVAPAPDLQAALRPEAVPCHRVLPVRPPPPTLMGIGRRLHLGGRVRRRFADERGLGGDAIA